MNVTEIQSIAQAAASKHYSSLLPRDRRTEAAYDAVTEAVFTGNTDHPYKVALRGIGTAVSAERKHHGLESVTCTGERYAAYWHNGHEPFTDQIEDTIAVRQVWNALPPAHQGTLTTFMNAGTVSAAAAIEQVPYGTFAYRLHAARKAARELWHSPEPSSPHWHKNQNGGEPWRKAVAKRKSRRKAQGERDV